MEINWTDQLVEQLDGHWTHQLRSRLDGLTDDEYFWEPAHPSWNVRPRDAAGPTLAVGTGAFTLDMLRPRRNRRR